MTFRIDDRSRAVRVRLEVFPAGRRGRARRVDFGARRTGVTHTVRLTGLEDGGLPGGRLKLCLRARDPSRRSLKGGARTSTVEHIALHGHRFPLAGTYSFSGPGGRFGAPRPGHIHQGQDLPAPQGTPILSPRGGTVSRVAYQAAGAGHYVVVDAAGEERDYVFMHMQAGSVAVRPGQRVLTGQRLGRVGNTGRSFGSHLHFEVWEGGPWAGGGHAVDPLPLLKRWETWS